VYCDIWYIFLIPQFLETPDDGYSPKVQFVQCRLNVSPISIRMVWEEAVVAYFNVKSVFTWGLGSGRWLRTALKPRQSEMASISLRLTALLHCS